MWDPHYLLQTRFYISENMWLIVILLLLLFLALLDTRRPKNFPPGPAWFPIIGCAWQIQKLCRQTGSLSKAVLPLVAEYGPLIGARIGRERVVIVCGLQQILEMFGRDELNGRPKGILSDSRTGGKRKGIVFNDSQTFQEHKKFVLRHLKDSKEIMEEAIHSELREINEDLTKRCKKNGTVPIDSLFGIPLLNMLWSLMAGRKRPLEDFEVNELLSIMEDFSLCGSLSGTSFSNFPFMKYLCPNYSGYNTYVDVHKRIINFVRERVEELRGSGANPGLIHAYLATLNSREKKDSFSEEQLLAVCMDLFIAGFETTYNTLQFFMSYIVLHQDVQTKAQKEIDCVVGRRRAVTLDDKPRLPYVESVVLESMRLFAGRGFLVPRRATQDTTFYGYFIPKDTILLGNSRGTLMDSKAGWKNPSAFDPDRYIKDGSLNVPSSFVIFGLGKRRCLGEILAKANLFLIVANMLQTFSFKAAPGSQQQVEVVEGFTPGVKPFNALVTIR
ncbi:hypothetical protein PPYR_14109 [Photinus pyralis]|uniref:Cytochrome P450 n=1 Tax=Photinus pyralis TaxID=7054 RepID=A0A1Y1M7B6_PHOPY|nr:probable cytochrome P450 303a1 [Photinus pyralis]KAB0792150.1 hypothetical protein PPYR_14109 [Photinus pyralis]